jgi:glutaredoxin
MPTTITVYVREGCHLCQAVLQQVEKVLAGRADVVVRQVDIRAPTTTWNEYALYQSGVPVVLVNGREIARQRLDPGTLERHLPQAGEN